MQVIVPRARNCISVNEIKMRKLNTFVTQNDLLLIFYVVIFY